MVNGTILLPSTAAVEKLYTEMLMLFQGEPNCSVAHPAICACLAA